RISASNDHSEQVADTCNYMQRPQSSNGSQSKNGFISVIHGNPPDSQNGKMNEIRAHYCLPNEVPMKSPLPSLRKRKKDEYAAHCQRCGEANVHIRIASPP